MFGNEYSTKTPSTLYVLVLITWKKKKKKKIPLSSSSQPGSPKCPRLQIALNIRRPEPVGMYITCYELGWVGLGWVGLAH